LAFAKGCFPGLAAVGFKISRSVFQVADLKGPVADLEGPLADLEGKPLPSAARSPPHLRLTV